MKRKEHHAARPGDVAMKASRGAGDKGKTGLFSGERVSKSHERIEACGEVDELNSMLGALAASVPSTQKELIEEIKGIQAALLAAGALLGASSASLPSTSLRQVTDEDVRALEIATDRIHGDLPKLDGFILPGGHASASWAHLARTVCRRAERRVVGLIEALNDSRAEGELGKVVVYLNRLSDYLFCVARQCNRVTGTEEEHWKW